MSRSQATGVKQPGAADWLDDILGGLIGGNTVLLGGGQMSPLKVSHTPGLPLVAPREPLLALLGGAVGPALRGDPALHRLLYAVVAHGGRGVERVGDVRLREARR